MMLNKKQLPKYEFSKEGHDKLVAEKGQLAKDRELAVEDLANARSMGDLSENGYYKAARAKLSSIDSRIRRVNLMIKYAVIIEKNNSGLVSFGSKVKVLVRRIPRQAKGREMEFEIVGREEADPGEGKLSNASPIGKALLNKGRGEKVIVKIPAGEIEYEILEVK